MSLTGECVEVEEAAKSGLDNKAKLAAALRQYTKASGIAIRHLTAFGLRDDIAAADELMERLTDIKSSLRGKEIECKYAEC